MSLVVLTREGSKSQKFSGPQAFPLQPVEFKHYLEEACSPCGGVVVEVGHD